MDSKSEKLQLSSGCLSKKGLVKAESKDNAKITDLNDFCLEYIFNYLSVNDLMNIDESSIVFKSAVRLVFQRKNSERDLANIAWTQNVRELRALREIRISGSNQIRWQIEPANSNYRLPQIIYQ